MHGLGHVAVRDFISFLKYDGSDANPLRGTEKAYAWGRSQTGRCLRDFVYRGFNADAQGGACSMVCCRTSPAQAGNG